MMVREVRHSCIFSFVRFWKERTPFIRSGGLRHTRSVSSCTSGARERAYPSPALIASKNFEIAQLVK